MSQTSPQDTQVSEPSSYVSKDLRIDSWEVIEPFYKELSGRAITSAAELTSWIIDRGCLQAVVGEEFGWRYIRMSCDTTNKEAADAYTFFIQNIQPKLIPAEHELDKKLLSNTYVDQLADKRYDLYLKLTRKASEIFRPENVPLITRLQQEQNEYSGIAGNMTIVVNDQELTFSEASLLLQHQNRTLREETYRKIARRRLQDRERIDDLYTNLIRLRNEIAVNANFVNYRDYAFAELGRFDYTADDCFQFHQTIASEVVPLAENLAKKRKDDMSLLLLRPWDMDVNYYSQNPLKPCGNTDELLEKSIRCFYGIRPFLGECLETMRNMKHLDLGVRKGKAPGGYNYPLHATGIPFIFMNATGSLRDLVTLVHEGGHAAHSFLSRNLEFTGMRDTPSEVSELASMSMELISMEHWDVFFDNPTDLKNAKRDQLERIISRLPWIAAIDKFQHWVYANPEHSTEERTASWVDIYKKFSEKSIDWSGMEDAFSTSWQKQLHLFSAPFYYIEYGMAQLGAIAIWRNYKQRKNQTINEYLDALKLGYTRSIPEIYRTAGIRFDFSTVYVRELMNFVREEFRNLL